MGQSCHLPLGRTARRACTSSKQCSVAYLEIPSCLRQFPVYKSASLFIRHAATGRVRACARRIALTRTIAYNLLVNLILRLLCHDPALEDILPFWRSGATSWDGEGHWAWFGHWLYGSRRSSSESGLATRPVIKGKVRYLGGKTSFYPRHGTKRVHSRPTTIYDPLPLPKAEARRSCFSAFNHQIFQQHNIYIPRSLAIHTLHI
jgi:hypothetical protein